MFLVVGSSGYLGESIVTKLVNHGSVLQTKNNNFNQNKAEDTDLITTFKLDITNDNDIKNIFSYIEKNKIVIKGVVLNQAFTYVSEGKDSFSSSHENIRRIFEVNYFGSVNFIEKLIEHLEKKNNKTRLVCILSNSLKTLNASSDHYIASKAALHKILKIFAKKYAERLVINFVSPGLMKSKMTDSRFKKVKNSILSKTPIGKLTEQDEVSNLVHYLLCECSDSIIGQNIFIDGGRTL